MAMTYLWTAMIGISILCGACTGRLTEVGAAAAQGAQGAVELTIAMAGMMCLWTGVMEVMRQNGMLAGLRKLLAPLLRRLFTGFRNDRHVMELIAANVSANLLGLGNAATPLGIQATEAMARRTPGRANDDLCLLVVCNTASIQLIPTTVAAVRSAAGCSTPFDILPAVWLASAVSVAAGVVSAKLLRRVWRD